MKRLTLCIILLLATIAFTQNAPIRYYLPDGTPLEQNGGFTNINDMTQKYFPSTPIYSHIIFDHKEEGGYASVIFKQLTDKALFVQTSEPHRIPDYIASFDYYEYLHDGQLVMDLQYSGIPTGYGDIYIAEALGPPTSRTSRVDQSGRIETWTYPEYGLILGFSQGRLTTLWELR